MKYRVLLSVAAASMFALTGNAGAGDEVGGTKATCNTQFGVTSKNCPADELMVKSDGSAPRYCNTQFGVSSKNCPAEQPTANTDQAVVGTREYCDTQFGVAKSNCLQSVKAGNHNTASMTAERSPNN